MIERALTDRRTIPRETPDRRARLDDLLPKWHQWQQGYRATRGHNNTATGMELYRASRQYDDQNGALDDAIENDIMRAVDHEISEMVDPHKAAIYVLARALTHGVMVFRSPRLPMDAAECDAIIEAARGILSQRLANAGVI